MLKKAYQVLTNPQVKKLRPNEVNVLNTANKSTIDFRGFTIQLYEWKNGPTEILLIHGWEGQAGNFSDIIQALTKNNFTVYAFDAAAHGYSSTGTTSLFDFVDLVGVLINKYKVKNLISHSFGGVATTAALWRNLELEIDKYLLLTTPDKFSERINEIVEYVGITEKVKQLLIDKLTEETQEDIYKLNVSEFVKTIKVKNALIIHDKNDRMISIEKSKNVAKNWKVGELDVIEGTGHFRILRTDFVIDKVVKFFK